MWNIRGLGLGPGVPQMMPRGTGTVKRKGTTREIRRKGYTLAILLLKEHLIKK